MKYNVILCIFCDFQVLVLGSDECFKENINASFLSQQIYRILGKTVVCYSIIFDLSDFYMSQDVMMLIDDIKVFVSFPLSN